MRYHFLLLKQHAITKLKYLCYHRGTIASCFTYKGSGVYWQRHLKKHGNNTVTTILEQSSNQEIIKEAGIKYSKLWNIVDSEEFANLVIENCSTTFDHVNQTELHKIVSEKTRQRQLGKTMAERLRIPNYISPHAGKSMKERCGENFVVWNKGKTMKQLRGDSYIDPKSKPFVVVINNKETITCNSEFEFFQKVNLPQPTLARLKKTGNYTVKRQSNSKHAFQTGDLIEFRWRQ